MSKLKIDISEPTAMLEWFKSNIPNSTINAGTFKYQSNRLYPGTNQKYEYEFTGVDIEFFEDDSVLFDMKYMGEYIKISDEFWRERNSDMGLVSLMKSLNHQMGKQFMESVSKSMIASMRAVCEEKPPVVALPKVNPTPFLNSKMKDEWTNPDAQIRKWRK